MEKIELEGIKEIINVYKNEKFEFFSISNFIRKVYNQDGYNSEELNSLLEKYTSDIKNRIRMMNIIINNDLDTEYRKYLVIKQVPLLETRNNNNLFNAKLWLDNALFLKKKSLDDIHFEDYIDYFGKDLSPEEITNIKNFFYDNKIGYFDYENEEYRVLRDTKIFGRKGKIIPITDEEKMAYEKKIVDDYNNAKYEIFNEQSPNEKNIGIVGNYCELLAYRNECKKYADNDSVEVIWIARDFGDGYGYDMMVVNHETNKTEVIEVKGKVFNYSANIGVELTDNEYKFYDDKKDKETDYKVKLVYVLRNDLSTVYDYIYDKQNDEFIIDSDIHKTREFVKYDSGEKNDCYGKTVKYKGLPVPKVFRVDRDLTGSTQKIKK